VALPSITEGQIAIDPINRIFYYIDGSGTLVNSSLNLLQASSSLISTDDSLSILGNTTIIESSVTILKDPTITLGGNSAPFSDDNKDRGVEFRWHNGTSAKVGFFGFDDSTGKFTFIPDATNTSEVFSGSLGEIEAKINWNNILDKPTFLNSITGTENEINVDSSSGNIVISLPATAGINISGTSAGWTTARKITLAGDLDGNVIIDGGSNVTLTANIVSNAVTLGTDTSGDYVANLTAGTGITIISGSGEQSQPIIQVTSNTYDTYGAAATAELNAATDASTKAATAYTDAKTYANTVSNTAYSNAVTYVNNLVLDNLSDVTLSNTANGDFLRYSSVSSAWINDAVNLGTDTEGNYVQSLLAGNNIVLSNHTGSEAVSPTISVSATPNFQSISANTLTVSGVSIDPYGASNTNQVLRFDGTKFIPGVASTVAALADLTDVSNTAPSVGDFLYWNGTTWTPSIPGTGMPIISDSSPVSPAAGQLWFQSNTARTFIYYIDNSVPPDSQWVEVGTIATNPDSVVSKVTQIIGNGASNTATVTHNLNTRNVIVQIYDNVTFETVEVRVRRNSLDSIEVNFSGNIPANAYTVVVMG